MITFDTLKFVRTLEASGVSRAQAEAFSNAVRDAHEAAELATKADLREMEQRLTIRLGLIVVAAIGAVATIMKWFNM